MKNHADKFVRELREEWKQVVGGYRRVISVTLLTGLRVAVMRSPVITGTLRNNWTVGSEPVPEGQDNGKRGGREGAGPNREQVAQIARVLREAGLFGRLVISNPMSYAPHVENGEGPGKRIPKPMAAPAVAAMNAILEANRVLPAKAELVLGGGDA